MDDIAVLKKANEKKELKRLNETDKKFVAAKNSFNRKPYYLSYKEKKEN